jgi:exodeoxyribonuclease VII small subunit
MVNCAPKYSVQRSATDIDSLRFNPVQQPESFESVYKQLEDVVRRLDEGGLTLDESIALYEQGMTLAKHCQTLLDHAELRVTQLQDLFAASLSGAVDSDEEEGDESTAF